MVVKAIWGMYLLMRDRLFEQGICEEDVFCVYYMCLNRLYVYRASFGIYIVWGIFMDLLLTQWVSG